jgi:phage terminase small subunit
VSNVEEILAKLRPKQRRFVLAYTGEAAGNATESARIAGYKGKGSTHRVVGHENLAKPNIRAAIEFITRPVIQSAIASNEELYQFWTDTMRDKKERASDRLKASELLGKTRALFSDRTIHEGSAEKPIHVWRSNGRGPGPEGVE